MKHLDLERLARLHGWTSVSRWPIGNDIYSEPQEERWAAILDDMVAAADAGFTRFKDELDLHFPLFKHNPAFSHAWMMMEDAESIDRELEHTDGSDESLKKIAILAIGVSMYAAALADSLVEELYGQNIFLGDFFRVTTIGDQALKCQLGRLITHTPDKTVDFKCAIDPDDDRKVTVGYWYGGARRIRSFDTLFDAKKWLGKFAKCGTPPKDN